LQSKFSVYHCFAVGLIDGAGGPIQFSDARATDPEITDLRRRVTVELDPTVARDECYASVSGAAQRSHHVKHATASKDQPMTVAQLREKLSLVTAPILGPARAALFAELALYAGDDAPIADLVAAATGERLE
jgi:2-methylcitrate dehydratase PrpD